MSKIIQMPKGLSVVALLLQLLFAFGCGPVRLISAYDEVLDEGTTALHSKVVGFVEKMKNLSGKPEGTYEANQGFYAEALAETSSLRMRAAAVPKNDITVNLFKELKGNLDRLKQLHQMGKEQGLTPIVADSALSALNVNFESILKLEIAKRRGDSE